MKNKQQTFIDEFISSPLILVEKGEFLLRAGEITDKFYYVEKGCLRSYIIDESGKEHIYQFAPEGWIIGDEKAAFFQAPAILYIDAIEDSTLRIMQKPIDDFAEDLDIAKVVLLKLHRKINAFRDRILLLLSATAEQRYEHFISTYPELIKRLPLKMVASYLGITPESLSRIRKEMASRK
jgi:CRP-like cAMP-binding protein